MSGLTVRSRSLNPPTSEVGQLSLPSALLSSNSEGLARDAGLLLGAQAARLPFIVRLNGVESQGCYCWFLFLFILQGDATSLMILRLSKIGLLNPRNSYSVTPPKPGIPNVHPLSVHALTLK